MERLTFKEMCDRFEVTPRTLRYYEYIELLSPERQGRARFYGRREIARMTLILMGRRFGFGLEEIRQWLDLYESEGSAAQMRLFLERADAQLEVLAKERRLLDSAIDDLRKARDEVAETLEAGKQR